VVNWSYSTPLVRISLPFSVAYETPDLRLVQKLAIEAARDTKRVLPYPDPVCHIVEFGDEGIKLSLRFWIGDPANGITNVKSNVSLVLWDLLQENKITVPAYPDQIYHIVIDKPETETPPP